MNDNATVTAIRTLANQFTSANVADSNGEQANIVDALAKIASAIADHAEAIRQVASVFAPSERLAELCRTPPQTQPTPQ